MLWLIAVLVAAIVISLLGPWGAVSWTLAIVVGLALWLSLAGLAGHFFGEPGAGIVIGLPFAVLFVAGIAEWARGDVDSWGNPTDPANRIRRRLPKGFRFSESDPKAEQARQEFFRRSREIEDRSRR